MLELFENYKNKGQTKQALLVAQNLLNKNPNDTDIFVSFFDYLLNLAEENDTIQLANTFLNQASGVLEFFSENTEIDKDVVELILAKEESLNRVLNRIAEKKNELTKESLKNLVIYHNDSLDLIEKLLNKIEACKKQEEFEKYLDDIHKIDEKIKKDDLTKKQLFRYEELTRKTSSLVSQKLSFFENLRNREYNMQAITAYEKVFNMFKNGKVTEGHKEILELLFSFDPSRLFNETLVYYNHVYNYILGQLSDDEKFLMTKYAIMADRRK